MANYTSSPRQPPPANRKHSLRFILDSQTIVRDAPDVPGVRSPRAPPSPTPSVGRQRHRPRLHTLPKAVLQQIAYHLVLEPEDKHRDRDQTGKPARLFPLFLTCRSIYDAISFSNAPELYNRLFRATFDFVALIRRTQWLFDVKTDIPGTSNKNKLFADPRAWAIEYKDRWALARRCRKVIAHQSVNVPGVSNQEHLDIDFWALWFLWTEHDTKNLHFLTQECMFHEWIIVYYKDDMLKDSLNPGYPLDTPIKALGIWTALLSGTDLLAEASSTEIDEKIFMLRPYVFACPQYEMMYASWHHRRLPMCASDCTEHRPINGYAAPYRRFGHMHFRAPPHFVLGAFLAFLRLLERQPARIGLKPGSTTFQPETAPGAGLFSRTHIMPSIYHDTEWQRNTVCQDPHTSPGLPPLTFLGRIKGFWRGKLLFYDFDSYRQMLAGNMRALYTGTFAQHVVELDLRETVIRVRNEDVGGKGSLLSAGFRDSEDSDEELRRIEKGYGHEVLEGDAIHAPERPGWTKEILISGMCRSSWGVSRVRGRIRAWDGLVTIHLGNCSPYPMGQWIWRCYIHSGGYLVGRWRDTYTPEPQNGYEGPLGLVRSGDLFYPEYFPQSMSDSSGTSNLELNRGGEAPGPAPGGVEPFRQTNAYRQRQRTHSINSMHTPSTPISKSASPLSNFSAGSDDPMDGSLPTPKSKRKAAEDAIGMRPASRGRRD